MAALLGESVAAYMRLGGHVRQVQLPTDLPLLHAAVGPGRVRQGVGQDAAQPGQQFLLGVAVEIGQNALGVEEGFLHDVGRPELPPQLGIDLAVGDQEQVLAASLE